MSRIKARCNECNAIISLYFDSREPDVPDVNAGEFFEYKCPVCAEWSAMEVMDEEK